MSVDNGIIFAEIAQVWQERPEDIMVISQKE